MHVLKYFCMVNFDFGKSNNLQVKADLNFQPLSPKNLFNSCSKFVIGPNRSFDDRLIDNSFIR